jgi:hypothetical protein
MWPIAPLHATLGIVVVAIAIGVGFTAPANAQSSYDRGYNNGYNDNFSAGGTPSPSTEYGNGFQAGQDDSYDDDEAERRLLDQQRRFEECFAAGGTDCADR